jgi:hypothetical protein
MRDPLAPLPSPTRDPGYWRSVTTPRGTRLPLAYRTSDADDDEYSPLRLLERNQGDTHGLDRRNRPRRVMHDAIPDGGDHGTGRLLSAAHRPIHAVLGLSTTHGWALVRALTIASAGVLLHLLDLLGPDERPEHRAEGRRVLGRLAPLLGAPLRPGAVHAPGSPLATVGGCLLAPRVVADLSSWASQPVGRRGTSQRRPTALTVMLMVPTATGIARIEGELVPMTDPQPEVLAVALTPRALAELERVSVLGEAPAQAPAQLVSRPSGPELVSRPSAPAPVSRPSAPEPVSRPAAPELSAQPGVPLEAG